MDDNHLIVSVSTAQSPNLTCHPSGHTLPIWHGCAVEAMEGPEDTASIISGSTTQSISLAEVHECNRARIVKPAARLSIQGRDGFCHLPQPVALSENKYVKDILYRRSQLTCRALRQLGQGPEKLDSIPFRSKRRSPPETVRRDIRGQGKGGFKKTPGQGRDRGDGREGEQERKRELER